MKLGFASAILPDLNFEQVIDFASAEGFAYVELMCWPAGKAERRYAGVTHLDAGCLDTKRIEAIQGTLGDAGVEISGLGYYPNLLSRDPQASAAGVDHLKRLVVAAKRLGVPVVNTFAGGDPARTVDDNWPGFLNVWRPLIRFAEDHGVRIAIENCPMFFTRDEWPGGKNLARSPAVWRRMFEDIPSDCLGLNYDPSHLVWQQMDYVKPIREFADRIFHVHAKDARIDRDRLDRVGIMACPAEFHTAKLPGLGEVQWGRFFSALGQAGYRGAVCIEVEDRAYEGTLERRKGALRQSARFLRQFMAEEG